MQILSQNNLDIAVKLLREGKTIVFPTETSYGLACDATNQQAVNKIFKIKIRPVGKPLLVVVPSVKMAKKYLRWNELLEKIAKKYWPGPITAVGNAKNRVWKFWQTNKLARGVIDSEDTVAVRVTDYPLAKILSERLKRPIVATSANLSSAGDIYDSQEIIRQFYNSKFAPDALIDGGVLPPTRPTTIVSVADNQFKILRMGERMVNI